MTLVGSWINKIYRAEHDKDDFAIKVEAYLSLEEFTIKDDNGR